MKNLEHLNLANNQITDISKIEQLKNLKSLWLYNNKITNISCIKSLRNLTQLSLSKNNIDSIEPLEGWQDLEVLHLQENQIKDLSPIRNCTKLITLRLNNNRISDITILQNFKQLVTLDLTGNKIKQLPTWITDFNMDVIVNEKTSYYEGLILSKNPIKNPPIEIVRQGKGSIQRYFKNIEKHGIDYIYEAKLILVGEGAAGKTSLKNRLLKINAALPKQDDRTRGIKIYDWVFKFIKGKQHVAHIWDFGGQDVYYPVHRFFLTENAVFILLASTRQNTHNFDYWIPTIFQFGGKSPIIIGQTCDNGNRVTWNDINFYVSNSDFNIIKAQALPYIELNLLKNNEGLAKIKKTAIEQLVNLPHYGKGVPSSWIPIREIIAKKSKEIPCISFEGFQQICVDSIPESFSDPSSIEDCAIFFHSIGVILWYHNHEDIKNWVILQPEWAMNAVYKIIDDDEIQNPKRNGTILAKDFKRLWFENFYLGKHEILKKMLLIFKIAFPKKHKKSDYLIPARLVSMPSEERLIENNQQALRVVYKYNFMPKGMVNQLSAELSRLIVSDDKIWNNAVNFGNENNTAICQVEEDFYNRQISMKARGKDARGLIMIVMNALKDIEDEYRGVKAKVFVPCTCEVCINSFEPTIFLYEKLIEWSSKQKQIVVCNESEKSISIDELLFNVGLANPTIMNINNKNTSDIKKMFISYSKFDEEYLKDFEDHLITLKQEGLATFNCTEIEFGTQWEKEIRKQLEECDIIVCLISVKFLNTDYITKIEIPTAIQQNKMIIPIVIKACDWETSTLGSYQAAQRGRIVSLDNDLKLLGQIKSNTQEERAAFWTAIIKELRKKVFK